MIQVRQNKAARLGVQQVKKGRSTRVAKATDQRLRLQINVGQLLGVVVAIVAIILYRLNKGLLDTIRHY